MQKGTGITKLAEAMLSVILALVGMSVTACELVTNSLATCALDVEVSTARSELTMSILMKFTSIGFHVHNGGRR